MNSPKPVSKSKGAIEAELSSKWKANARTIRRWEAEGAPLDDDGAMRVWLGGRRKIPAGTAALLVAQPDGARAVPPPKPKIRKAMAAIVSGEPIERGAAAALKRLEQDEADLWTRLRALESDAEADPKETEMTRDAWRKTGDSLRRYDLAIEQSRRDSGLLVPRSELEGYAAGFVVHFVGAIRAALEACCPNAAGLPTPADVWRVLSGVLDRSLADAIRNSSTRPYAGKECPAWLAAVVEDAIRKHS